MYIQHLAVPVVKAPVTFDVRCHMTPILHVSLALERDASEIAAMSRELIERGLPWTWGPERVSKSIAAPNVNVAVVREQQGLSAFGIMEYWDDDAHLVLFAVRPNRQRQGIGTAVLRWLEASAVVAGAKRIRVEARRDNLAARSFYNEHGYHELSIKSHMYSGTLDGIQLEKWLRTTATGDA
jgi:ribosomal-protein-alanine N-acetyltransferase